MTLSRREFLKLSGVSLAATALPQIPFPQTDRLARITDPEVPLYKRPQPDSPILGVRSFDELLEVGREVVGRGVYPHNNVWLETPEGFIWSSAAQLVRDAPNTLLEEIPQEGIWTELTIPYADGRTKADPSSPVRYRLYYGMVLNINDRVVGTDGQIWYRVHDENGVVMFAPGEAFRAISPAELAPISPNVEDKVVVVNITRQEISALESGSEVYFARISSGYAYYPEGGNFTSNTPIGKMWTWRKMVSRHMSGGDAVTGYDLPGVGWTVLFHGSGAALHSTYWHADFGAPRSRGCINLLPEDAKWLFRWTYPVIDYRPGDLTVQWPNPGTRVIVEV
ncbi:MAG: L,D-transpeptidase family protein [Anaerolineales bacterium]